MSYTVIRATFMREYVMSARLLSRIRNHSNRVLCCNFCDKPIELGEETVSRRASRKQKRYHAKCYEGTLH